MTATIHNDICPNPLGTVTAYAQDGIAPFVDFLSYANIADSDTVSVASVQAAPSELIPFDCSMASGALDFWNDEKEDIYSSDDGRPL